MLDAAGRTILATTLVLALALATSALAWISPNPSQSRGGGLNVAAGGAMRIEDSRAGGAILRAPALAPGTPLVGKVTIRNQGDPGYLVLSRRRLAETPGAGAATLGDRLRLTVRSLAAGSRTLVYSGPLSAMPPLRLGLR